MSVSQSSGQPIMSVPRPRWLCVATGTASRICAIWSSSKPSLEEARPRALGDEALRARACGHALRRDADEPARSRRRRHRRAVQRVDLLRLDPRHRRRLVLRVARADGDLGAQRVLPAAHELGDVHRELFGPERCLAEDDLADRVVHRLLEARHVRALLVGPQVDEALELRGEQAIGTALVQPDDLLHARDAHAREADVERRRGSLDIREGPRVGGHGPEGSQKVESGPLVDAGICATLARPCA